MKMSREKIVNIISIVQLVLWLIIGAFSVYEMIECEQTAKDIDATTKKINAMEEKIKAMGLIRR